MSDEIIGPRSKSYSSLHGEIIEFLEANNFSLVTLTPKTGRPADMDELIVVALYRKIQKGETITRPEIEDARKRIEDHRDALY